MLKPVRLCIALLLIGNASFVAAQSSYPSKPVRLVVPFAPGGGADIISRAFGQKLSEAFGQSVLVENRAGASGAIGIDIVAKSPPDGYTLLIHSSTYTTNAAFEHKSQLDAAADVMPIVRLDKGPLLVVVHPALPVKTIKELIALAATRPGQLIFCSAGTGSIQRLATEVLMRQTRISMVHVPYKGLGPAITDLVGGYTQLVIGSLPSVLSQVHANRLRAIAVTSAERSSFVPEVPTVAESGIPGYSVELWVGMFGPPRMPGAIVARLDTDLRRILDSAEMKKRLEIEGAEPAPLSAPEFSKVIADEIAMWRKVVIASGIKPE